MNQLQRLQLLSNILGRFTPSNAASLGRLANEIESIYLSLEDCKENFSNKYFQLWDTLEIIAVSHQINGTTLLDSEVTRLTSMIENLKAEVDREMHMA